MMHHDEIGRGDFVLLDEISPESFIQNLRIRYFNFCITMPVIRIGKLSFCFATRVVVAHRLCNRSRV